MTEPIYTLTVQGSLVTLKECRLGHAAKEQKVKRGDIKVFSGAARRRMLQMMARFDLTDVRTVFMTLTFKGIPTYEEAKKALRRFLERVRRRYQGAACVWRMELQERGSVHFHLLWFGLPYWEQEDIKAAWTECTKEVTSGVHVKLLTTKKAAMIYVGKYIAKRDERSPSALLVNEPYSHAVEMGKSGKWYGVFNSHWLPYARTWVEHFKDADMFRYAMWYIRCKSRGRASTDGRAAFVFDDDGMSLMGYMRKHAWYSGHWVHMELRARQMKTAHWDRETSLLHNKQTLRAMWQ